MLRNVDLSPSPWLPSSAILCQDVCGLCVKKYAGGFQTLNASRIFFLGKESPSRKWRLQYALRLLQWLLPVPEDDQLLLYSLIELLLPVPPLSSQICQLTLQFC